MICVWSLGALGAVCYDLLHECTSLTLWLFHSKSKPHNQTEQKPKQEQERRTENTQRISAPKGQPEFSETLAMSH